MNLIVGLGNPGKKYEETRHNVGFLVVRALAEMASASFQGKFSGKFAKGVLGGKDAAFLMPETFMNLSGDSAQPAAKFLKLGVADVIVVHDELDIPFGTVRIKEGGGHAGHNGLRSLIERFGAPDFVRVRVGIGRPPADFKGDVADFVLQKFAAEERARVPALIDSACEVVKSILVEGPKISMNKWNAKAPTSPSAKA